MSLHKWCFSHSTNDFPDLHFDESSEENMTKTLGVLWNSSDIFCFKVSSSTSHIFTKRDVLYQIARIFDPLGSPRTCDQQGQIFHAAIMAFKVKSGRKNYLFLLPQSGLLLCNPYLFWKN
ncbi:uncharacterized protein TNCT_481951 [Trichonephila clavata]|uniref:Uncharacterized protein n=1 Tax=Trichonephila clavata TaxID=2740835 RepID=A0A8X6LE73_TRICU|nr:uncharacterized protein TNCT_481951 [Trichonephila clavata]